MHARYQVAGGTGAAEDDVHAQYQVAGGRRAAEGVGSPITNEAYDVLTALQAKLEGMEAYRKYSKDGAVPLWQRLTEQDMQSVRLLVDELERLVRDGRFRILEPGRANP